MKKPQMLQNYLEFCKKKNRCDETNRLDLGNQKWLYPTTLLPLGNYIKNNEKHIQYNPPMKQGVANYINLIIEGEPQEDKSYVPLVVLPSDQDKAEKVLALLYKLHNQGKEYGGESAFKYLIGELVTNIYEHSEFSTAAVMAQKYSTKKFVEICIFDNGITIPGSFKKQNIESNGVQALAKALSGISTKKDDERGFGLPTSVKMFTKGAKGELLIVSGKAAAFCQEKEKKFYSLQDKYKLEGTLIGVRFPIPTKKINIYKYIEDED